MNQLLFALPWWDCLRWLIQLRQPGWYHYLQHLNREISIPGAAQGIQGRIWRMGFTVLPTPYPAWVAAHRSMSYKVLSGLYKPLALPIALLCLSRGNLFLRWVDSGPMTTRGETTHTRDADEAPTKQWKVCVCVGMGFWRLGSCSPCWLAHLFSQGWAMPLWSAFSVFCTDRCLMLRWKLWKAKFLHTCKTAPGQWWANLSQFWLHFSNMHNCGCSCQI